MLYDSGGKPYDSTIGDPDKRAVVRLMSIYDDWRPKYTEFFQRQFKCQETLSDRPWTDQELTDAELQDRELLHIPLLRIYDMNMAGGMGAGRAGLCVFCGGAAPGAGDGG